ncbi:30S ribosomal protein S11 [Candidatus Parcubacteria bacterium]|nr:30S ribosomal protein S11 [Candidatus Parcubacteria bacterium]
MGKKRIIGETTEELLKQQGEVEALLKKAGESAAESRRRIARGRVYVHATYNNTIITLTDANGNVLGWASAGMMGFKGPRKATPFAATRVAEIVAEKAKKIGVQSVNVFVQGVGSGRESAVRAISSHGIDVAAIKDITPIPHNGCRPPKERRV